eukprot:g3780.t1
MGPKKSGKKWHHHQQPKRPRHEEDNGGDNSSELEQRPKKPRRAAVINLGNVKGHQAVVATCDIRNDRQATAELVDLLNAVADDMYPADDEEDEVGNEGEGATVGPSPTATTPTGKESGGGGDETGTEKSTPSATEAGATPAQEKSVEDMIREEAAELRSGKVKTHRFKSVDTTVKGVVMVCVMDPKIDILRLVDALYAEIRTTKMRRSRFLERVTPLQVTAYSDVEAFKEAAKPVVSAGLPPVADGVPPLPVVVRAAKAGGVKVEAGAAATKETPAAEAPAGAPVEATNAEAKGCAAARSRGDKVDVDDEKQAAAPAAATPAGAPGVGAPSERKKEGSASTGGKNMKTSDKRWKFRVDIRRRNSALNRLDLINAVVGSVGEGHSVSMSAPEVTIAIEAVKCVVGTSVLFNYALNHEYSISRLQDAVCGAILDS